MSLCARAQHNRIDELRIRKNAFASQRVCLYGGDSDLFRRQYPGLETIRRMFEAEIGEGRLSGIPERRVEDVETICAVRRFLTPRSIDSDESLEDVSNAIVDPGHVLQKYNSSFVYTEENHVDCHAYPRYVDYDDAV